MTRRVFLHQTQQLTTSPQPETAYMTVDCSQRLDADCIRYLDVREHQKALVKKSSRPIHDYVKHGPSLRRLRGSNRTPRDISHRRRSCFEDGLALSFYSLLAY